MAVLWDSPTSMPSFSSTILSTSSTEVRDENNQSFDPFMPTNPGQIRAYWSLLQHMIDMKDRRTTKEKNGQILGKLTPRKKLRRLQEASAFRQEFLGQTLYRSKMEMVHRRFKSACTGSRQIPTKDGFGQRIVSR